MIVEISNPTGVDKFIKKGVVLGDVCAVSAVIPMRIFESETADLKSKPTCEVNQVNKFENDKLQKSEERSEPWMPDVDLSHLDPAKREIFEKLL